MTAQVQKVITLGQDELLAFCGFQDRRLKKIQTKFRARIIPRGNEIRVSGSAEEVDLAWRVIRDLLDVQREGKGRIEFTEKQLQHVLAESDEAPEGHVRGLLGDHIPLPNPRLRLTPLTRMQKEYVEAIRARDIVFGIGPAGTGKTYLAMAMAVSHLVEGLVRRIILVRPAVEAGESLGFLPGDLSQKLDPYVRPLYDALYEMMEADKIREMIEQGTIEIAPLAYMRGRTLNQSFVILDEAQNTSIEQMKMFLTRMGFDSKVVITGDVTQVDLPKNKVSGLVHVQQILAGIPEITFIQFTRKDVVRHELVQRIIEAYESMGKSSLASLAPERAVGARALRPGAGRAAGWVSASVWFLLTFLSLAPLPDFLPVTIGERVGENIAAPQRIEVPDEDATAAEKERIRQAHPRIWTYQPGVRGRARERISQAAEYLMTQKPESGADITRIAAELDQKARIHLKTREIDILYGQASLERLRENLLRSIDRILDTKVLVGNKELLNAQRHERKAEIQMRGIPDELRMAEDKEHLGWPDELRRHLLQIELPAFYPSGEDRPLVEVAARMAEQALEPNLEFNTEETNAGLNDALQALEINPIKMGFEAGTIIVRRDAPLTGVQAAAMERVNAVLRSSYPWRLGGVALLTLLCFAAVGAYLRGLRRPELFTPSSISMLCLPVLMALGLGRLIHHLDVLPPESHDVLFPVALVGMLTTTILNSQVAFALVIATSVLSGVATGQGLEFEIVALFGGFTSVISLRVIRERKDVLAAGLLVGTVNASAVLILSLFRTPPSLNIPSLGWAMLNGIMCAWATLPLMVIFERAFGVVTDIRLLEITGPQNELLRELEEKAPGTYEHVLSVAKLAEAAAEEIGANALLVRAGALFHDVGKMLKPKYFSENQVTLEDKRVHSKISPYMSTLIIKNHVKEGIEIARKAGLPEKVIDFIPQHHGSSLIKFFYSQAVQRYEETESTAAVREEDFRYPGPTPQSVETGIVMLADSVEATVTATFTDPKVNEIDLRRTVTKVVTDRFNDGQFDECDITLRDLYVIRETFIRTLKARFHHRVAYPNMPARKDGVPVRDARDSVLSPSIPGPGN